MSTYHCLFSYVEVSKNNQIVYEYVKYAVFISLAMQCAADGNISVEKYIEKHVLINDS